MNKTTRIILAIGLILAVATPALAEFKFSGAYNLKFYNEEKKSDSKANTTDEEGDTQQWIDQRFRARLDYTLNDNVSVTYFAEVDTPWGEPGKAAYGQGGMVTYRTGGADGVNIETKNMFLTVKSGDTVATLGIQGVADSFESIVANDDMAAVKVVHKIGNTTLTGVYSKWDEENADSKTAYTFMLDQNGDKSVDEDDLAAILTGLTSAQEAEVLAWVGGGPAPSAATMTALEEKGSITLKGSTSNAISKGRSDWDDFDFWAAEVKHKFSDAFTAGAGVYFMDDNDANGFDTADKEVFFYGLNGAFTSGNFGVNGFAMIQDGEYDAKAAGGDYDYEGWAASLKGTMKLENGDLGLRLIYFSEDDDTSDNGRWQGFQGEYSFVNENQMQFLVDKFVANDGKEQYAIKDAIDGGYGLMAAILSGNHKLPDSMYLNWGVGYYRAVEDNTDENASSKDREGKTLGYEVAARIGKKFFEKVDVSLNASWADYGNFYDKTAADGDDPDSTYKTYLMVNVPF